MDHARPPAGNFETLFVQTLFENLLTILKSYPELSLPGLYSAFINARWDNRGGLSHAHYENGIAPFARQVLLDGRLTGITGACALGGRAAGTSQRGGKNTF